MKFAHPKRKEFEDVVLNHQSLTPSEMMELYKNGQPISCQIAAVSSSDGSVNPSWDMPPELEPNVEASEIFEESMKSKEKIEGVAKKITLSHNRERFYNQK